MGGGGGGGRGAVGGGGGPIDPGSGSFADDVTGGYGFSSDFVSSLSSNRSVIFSFLFMTFEIISLIACFVLPNVFVITFLPIPTLLQLPIKRSIILLFLSSSLSIIVYANFS